MTSCVLIYTSKSSRINEVVAAWQSQTLEGSELVIVNCQLRQRLKTDIAGIRIINMTRPIMPPQARNMAIEATTGDIIVTMPEDDIILPNHLQNIATAIEGKQWTYLDKEFLMERGKITKIEQAGTAGFAFTKKAWLDVGKYSFGVNGASDRNFIGKLTAKFAGEKAILNPSHVSYIRMGTENEKRANVRMALPGDVILKPELKLDYVGAVRTFFGGKTDKKIGVVILGRNGDILNILPFIKLIADNYAKPTVYIASEFLPLFDGISYAIPVVAAEHESHLGQAIAKAKRECEIVVNTQIWGHGFSQEKTEDSYNRQSWKSAGLLHRFNDETLRPVFDKRDEVREQTLLSEVLKPVLDLLIPRKPLLLVQLTGGKSSPCPACPSLMPSIQERWGEKYNIVDLSQIRAERLYDFIELMEISQAIVCIDSAFLHLAAATNIPVVALTNPTPWAGTVVRMNCVAHIPYDKATADFELVHKAIEGCISFNKEHQYDCTIKELPKGECFLRNGIIETPRVNRRIFHACDRYDDSDAKALERKKQCWASWDELYATGELIPAHCWSYPRNARDTMGDRRALPYLRDLLSHAMDQMDDEDILLWSNDDNLLHPQIAEYLKFHVSVYGACSMFRTEFRGKVASLELTPEQFGKSGTGSHIGRDGFAFTKAWLVEHWQEIGDVILGASDWDIYLAAFIRLQYGIKTTKVNLGQQIFPAEIPNGYTGHSAHHSTWNTPDVNSVPSNRHNRLIFRNWATAALPELKFTENNTL